MDKMEKDIESIGSDWNKRRIGDRGGRWIGIWKISSKDRGERLCEIEK
jgi:hypothetical protein